jgi:ActR/RegA family two-component response regulator
MDDYVSKPTRIDDLSAALARVREVVPEKETKVGPTKY